jgi:hypothetical protein
MIWFYDQIHHYAISHSNNYRQPRAAKKKAEGHQKPHRKEIIVLEARAAYTDQKLRDILLAEDRNDETPTVSQRQLTNKDQLTNKHPSWALAHDTSSAKNSENTESTDQGLLCMQQKCLGLTNMLDAMTSFTSTLSFEACSSPQSSIVIPPNTDTRKLERDHKSIMKKRT